MNQSFESESYSDYTSGYHSSIDIRTFPKLENGKLQTETLGYSEKNSGKVGGQDYCFSAARLKQYIEFNKLAEQKHCAGYFNDDHLWMKLKQEEYNRYNRIIEEYLEYLLSSTSFEMQSARKRRIQEMKKLNHEVLRTKPVLAERQTEARNRKRRLCRHFLKGWCKRGKSCDFLHDSSIFCPDLQKVFLGGLPSYVTESTLKRKLAEQGYNVINQPKVLRGFTPQVCLGSVEEAQRLIKKGKIMIDDSQVDVRPYEEFAKNTPDNKPPDDIKRSVFLGGLPNGTTGKDIVGELEKLDVKVVNHPLIKAGFTPQVILGNAKQAEKLVNLKKVRIRKTLVDIRPYVNYRVGSNRSRKYVKYNYDINGKE